MTDESLMVSSKVEIWNSLLPDLISMANKLENRGFRIEDGKVVCDDVEDSYYA